MFSRKEASFQGILQEHPEDLQINMNYQYEANDIQEILSGRLIQLSQEFPQRFSKTISVLATIDNIVEGQLEQRLQQERNVDKGEHISLIPCNLGNYHWIGILIEFQADGQIKRAEYIDSLNDTTSSSIIFEQKWISKCRSIRE
ncbi:unnamed protein product [Didymodactylos carnosus]|uniref:Uncharacterized protein n=1 Tax=Didymodactylos carnosus TaxID=1234261 RepID=A0A8S2HU33_9BILA|nr:unnamed protein product [Didymodactylos carnosus]CAF3678091.1 unnamed protein product [Didymodactylos carnosus]